METGKFKPGQEKICKKCIYPLQGNFIPQSSPCQKEAEIWARGDSTHLKIVRKAGKIIYCEGFKLKSSEVFKDRARQVVIALFSLRP